MKVAAKKGILLDVGCRGRKEPNWFGIDRKKRVGVDVVHDLEKTPYPLPSGSCLTIKAAHVVEHIKPWLFFPWMDEMWRLLKVDGQLAISSPYAGSQAFWQDPTHVLGVNEATFQHVDPRYPLYMQYEPKPWKIEHLAWKPVGNIEVVLRKMHGGSGDGAESLILAHKAISMGAMQKTSELAFLIDFLKDRKLRTIVEIGTARGGVLYALCQIAAENATLVSLDLPGGKFGGGYGKESEQTFRSYAKPKQTLHFLRKDSHLESTRAELSKIIGRNRKADCLLIDGDHTYEGVKSDWEMYHSFVGKDGVVIFHDICKHPFVPECQVERFWNELKVKHKYAESIDIADTTWGGIGVIYL